MGEDGNIFEDEQKTTYSGNIRLILILLFQCVVGFCINFINEKLRKGKIKPSIFVCDYINQVEQ